MLSAGAQLLDGVTPSALQVQGVCRAAGVAKGTFYVHFPSKEALLAELCNGYVAFEAETFPGVVDPDPYRQVYDTVAWYERVFAANVGIMRCLVEMAGTSDAFLDTWLRRNRQIVDRMTERLTGLLGVPAAGAGPLRAIVNSLGGMLDQSLYARYRVGPRWILGDGTLEASIEIHALVAYRALFGSNPALPRTASLQALIRDTDLEGRVRPGPRATAQPAGAEAPTIEEPARVDSN